MSNERHLTRREACAGLLGCAGGLLAIGQSGAAETGGAPPAQPKAAGKKRAPLNLAGVAFYGPDGKFDEAAAKKAYLQLCRSLGYPLNDSIRKNLAVTDFGLGSFTEVGLAYVVWVDDAEANYASLEVFLLPGQMIPEHWHVALEAQSVTPKRESWIVRYGSTFTYGPGDPTPTLSVKIPECQKSYVSVLCEKPLLPGEVASVGAPLEKHWQLAGPDGCIFTEVSTYHTGEAVRFSDPKVKF